MLTLALETASEIGGLAILVGERVIAERECVGERHHARSLLVELDRLLDDSERRLEEVELIALSIGPGSFTGLRVGLATALGLCFDTPRLIVPVPTLAALSLQAGDLPGIVPLLDARKQQIYTGLYGPGAQVRCEDRVCRPRAWFERLRGEGPVCLLGPAAESYRAEAVSCLGDAVRILEPEQGRPRASSVGRLAAQLAREGGACSPESVQLRYLRRAEAEELRAAGHATRESIS